MINQTTMAGTAHRVGAVQLIVLALAAGTLGSQTASPAQVSAPSVVVSSSANPSDTGDSVTFTAAVSPVAPATGTPTGTVSFLDGATSLGTQALANGQAEFATSTLTAGTHNITVSYSGDANFAAATSAAIAEVVNSANLSGASVVLSSSANPTAIGQSVTFTAAVSPAAPATGTPTGTVTFLDGTNPLGTQTLANGQAALSTSALTAGSHSITAAYSGDTNFAAATSAALTQSVLSGATVTLTSSLNPASPGTSVTFTAAVSAAAPATGTPTGTVTFLDGKPTLGSQALTNGTATFSTSTLKAGSDSITASYSGDTNFSSATSPVLIQLIPSGVLSGATIALVSSTDPSVIGQPVSFTATLSAAAPAAGTPTGIVTFLDGTNTLGTQALSNGRANFTTSVLTPGSHGIKASYSGDVVFAPASSKALTQVVVLTAPSGPPPTQNVAATPFAWGSGRSGDLGDGSTNGSTIPVPVSSLTNVVGGGAGDGWSVMLQIDGAVWTFGSNSNGQLGNGQNDGPAPDTSADSDVPVQVQDPTDPSGYLTNIVAVAAGEDGLHCVALKNDGTVRAWGSNSNGQLGNNSQVDTNLPVEVQDPTDQTGFLTGVIAVKAGQTFSLALKGDGTVWAWGGNGSGQLGDNLKGDSSVPVQVVGLTAVQRIGVGYSFGQAILEDGTAWEWGNNNAGQLGNNNTNNSRVPVQVQDPNDPSGFLTRATYISGGGSHTVAVKTDGTAWAWGDNTNGQLGNNTTVASLAPVQVQDPTDVTGFLTGMVAIAGGAEYSLGLKNDGTVRGWGLNGAGQLGDGTNQRSLLPVTATGLVGVIVISCGLGHSVGIGNLPIPSVTLTSSQNPSVSGMKVTFAATFAAVAPTTGIPSGSVTFTEDTTTLAVVRLVNGQAQFTTSTLSKGNHNITVTYGGDNLFASTSASLIQAVAVPSNVLTSSLNPANLGQSITFIATLSSISPEVGVPTGTVTFYDGSTALATVNVANGQAQYITTNLTSGTHTITAVYNGNSVFGASISNALSETIIGIGSTNTLSVSPNPSSQGQNVTLTVAITGAGPAPTGSVMFNDGSTAIGSATVTAGVATLSLTTLSAGSHTIAAVYSGDGSYLPNASNTVTQVVNNSGGITLTSSMSPSPPGQSITFTAVVASDPFDLPTGLVTFNDTFNGGSEALGDVSLNGNTVTLTTSTLAVGIHTITAVYGGDSNYAASSSIPVVEAVGLVSANVTFTSSLNPSQFGQNVAFTVAVSAVGGNPLVPTGTVAVSDGGTPLVTLDLTAGQASFSTSTLSGGTHTLTAVYSGDANFNPSQAPVLTQVVYSVWMPADISVGDDNLTRVLWTNPDGRVTLWSLDQSTGGYTQGPVFGPYQSYTAARLACGPDGVTHILWNKTDGTLSLWWVNSDNTFQQNELYGPFAGWVATDIAVGVDNLTRILWTNTNDGRAVIWSVDSTGVRSNDQNFYGPYPGYTAIAVACGADGLTRLLWSNPTGPASLWVLGADNTQQSYSLYGPFAGWLPVDIALGSDNLARVLWNNINDGRAVVWSVGQSGARSNDQNFLGPFPGYTARSIACGTDGYTRLTWVRPDGTLSFWNMAADNTMLTFYLFGPYY